jgi:hypothetical protein
MKKLFLQLLLTSLIFVMSSFLIYSQDKSDNLSWQEMLYSARFYNERAENKKALQWGEKSNFYSNWVTGMTKREAFSKAQLKIKAKYKSPYYWGAFVMVGE